jgi:hypothetical protein
MCTHMHMYSWTWSRPQHKDKCFKECFICQSLAATPVILATQKTEIKRIMVQSQPRQRRDHILKTPNTKKGWCNGSSSRASFQQAWGPELKTLVLPKKKKKTVRRRRMAHSPSLRAIVTPIGSKATPTTTTTPRIYEELDKDQGDPWSQQLLETRLPSY